MGMVPAQQEVPDVMGGGQCLDHSVQRICAGDRLPLVQWRYPAAATHVLGPGFRAMKLRYCRSTLAIGMFLLALAGVGGCSKRQAVSVATPADAQAALQQAFQQAKPEVKTA